MNDLGWADHEEIVKALERDLDALRGSHKAMLEALVQILEEIMYPIDKLMPDVEAIIANAEQLEAGWVEERLR